MNGIYLYGIVEVNEDRSYGPIGMQNSPVHTVHYRDIAAVVSNTSAPECEPTIENALTHENVIRKLIDEGSIIPMSFGNVAGNKHEVEAILKAGYGKFKELLRKTENKIQVDVRVLWETDKIYTDILTEEKEILKSRENVLKKPQLRSKKIQLGKMVKTALDEKREKYKGEIKDVLGELSQETMENRLINDKMIMNMSFLISKDEESEFYDKVNLLDEKYGNLVEVVGVGPLPPYNFTRMEVKRIDFKEIDAARKTLGLGIEAQMDEIEQAYRDLAYKYHPDRNKAPSAERLFKQLEKAYAILINYCKHQPGSTYSFREKDVEHTMMVIAKSRR